MFLHGLRKGVGQFHKPRNPLQITYESGLFNPCVYSKSKLPVFLQCILIAIQCEVCQLHYQIDFAIGFQSLIHSSEEVLIFVVSDFCAKVSNKAGVCCLWQDLERTSSSSEIYVSCYGQRNRRETTVAEIGQV